MKDNNIYTIHEFENSLQRDILRTWDLISPSIDYEHDQMVHT